MILDQRVVAGLGNIYADEALWRARLSPLRAANSLGDEEIARLHRAIRAALRLGIERQGSTLRDYAQPDGSSGEMQDEFRVYGREGEPCPRCRAPIAKARVGGRGTWYCPSCQPPPVGRRQPIGAVSRSLRSATTEIAAAWFRRPASSVPSDGAPVPAIRAWRRRRCTPSAAR